MNLSDALDASGRSVITLRYGGAESVIQSKKKTRHLGDLIERKLNHDVFI